MRWYNIMVLLPPSGLKALLSYSLSPQGALCCATLCAGAGCGCDLWPTFSLISSALLHRGSASLYFPLFPYRTARLLSVAATWQGKKKGGSRLKKSWSSAPQTFITRVSAVLQRHGVAVREWFFETRCGITVCGDQVEIECLECAALARREECGGVEGHPWQTLKVGQKDRAGKIRVKEAAEGQWRWQERNFQLIDDLIMNKDLVYIHSSKFKSSIRQLSNEIRSDKCIDWEISKMIVWTADEKKCTWTKIYLKLQSAEKIRKLLTKI